MSKVDEVLEKASQAAAIFSQLDQEHTDRIVRAVYQAGFNNRVKLARMAQEETGIGKWEDKVIKNVVGTQLVYEDIRHEKTVGIISEDLESGITEIAQPLGPVLAVIPVTNPTSTVMFKILIAMKTRNPIIISPHRGAARCSIEAARICYEAALSEDAPEDCIQWIEHTSREETHALMSHRSLALIIATGGGGLVNAAYSSGNPALGVGAGNVPVFIEKSADIPFAVEEIFTSKTFDNGTVCCSEQSVVVEKEAAQKVMDEFRKRKAHFLTDAEIEMVEKVAFDEKRGIMSAAVVGKSPVAIAAMAGVKVPEDTRLLVAPLKGIGPEYKLSSEILAPIIGFFVANDFDHAVKLCIDLNFFGGIGHTASVFSNDEEKIKKFALLMNAGRIVVNMPSSQGGVGGIFNTLHPSLTLGCGTAGKNITTDNITARHLLNIQRITRRRVNQRFGGFDTSLYFDESMDAGAIEALYNRNY
jgi:acetaldehyde dehydrogenase/alcohol dehydrogenase